MCCEVFLAYTYCPHIRKGVKYFFPCRRASRQPRTADGPKKPCGNWGPAAVVSCDEEDYCHRCARAIRKMERLGRALTDQQRQILRDVYEMMKEDEDVKRVLAEGAARHAGMATGGVKMNEKGEWVGMGGGMGA